MFFIQKYLKMNIMTNLPWIATTELVTTTRLTDFSSWQAFKTFSVPSTAGFK